MDEENTKPVDIKKNKESKELVLAKMLLQQSYPYFIESNDGSEETPINTLDCIRIYDKLNELKEDPWEDPWLWSPIQLAQFNIKDMTVIMDNKSSETLFLVRGKTYERPRGKSSLRADATNCNLKGKWPKEFAEFA